MGKQSLQGKLENSRDVPEMSAALMLAGGFKARFFAIL
jgi:hypothetical protein